MANEARDSEKRFSSNTTDRSSEFRNRSDEMINEYGNRAREYADELGHRASEYYDEASVWMRENYGRVAMFAGILAAAGFAGYFLMNRFRRSDWEYDRSESRDWDRGYRDRSNREMA